MLKFCENTVNIFVAKFGVDQAGEGHPKGLEKVLERSKSQGYPGACTFPIMKNCTRNVFFVVEDPSVAFS